MALGRNLGNTGVVDTESYSNPRTTTSQPKNVSIQDDAGGSRIIEPDFGLNFGVMPNVSIVGGTTTQPSSPQSGTSSGSSSSSTSGTSTTPQSNLGSQANTIMCVVAPCNDGATTSGPKAGATAVTQHQSTTSSTSTKNQSPKATKRGIPTFVVLGAIVIVAYFLLKGKE